MLQYDGGAKDLLGHLVNLGVPLLLDHPLDQGLDLGPELLEVGLDNPLPGKAAQGGPGRIVLNMADKLFEDLALAHLGHRGEELDPGLDLDHVGVAVGLEGPEDPAPVGLEVEGQEDLEEVRQVVGDVYSPLIASNLGLLEKAALSMRLESNFLRRK